MRASVRVWAVLSALAKLQENPRLAFARSRVFIRGLYLMKSHRTVLALFLRVAKHVFGPPPKLFGLF